MRNQGTKGWLTLALAHQLLISYVYICWETLSLDAHLSCLWKWYSLLVTDIDSNGQGILLVTLVFLPTTVIISMLPLIIECWNLAFAILKSCHTYGHWRVPWKHTLLSLLALRRQYLWVSQWSLIKGRSFSPSWEHSQLVDSLLLLLLSRFSRVRLCATPWWQPIRLHRPWDSPGKNTGVGCHFLL